MVQTHEKGQVAPLVEMAPELGHLASLLLMEFAFDAEPMLRLSTLNSMSPVLKSSKCIRGASTF